MHVNILCNRLYVHVRRKAVAVERSCVCNVVCVCFQDVGIKLFYLLVTSLHFLEIPGCSLSHLFTRLEIVLFPKVEEMAASGSDCVFIVKSGTVSKLTVKRGACSRPSCLLIRRDKQHKQYIRQIKQQFIMFYNFFFW